MCACLFFSHCPWRPRGWSRCCPSDQCCSSRRRCGKRVGSYMRQGWRLRGGERHGSFLFCSRIFLVFRNVSRLKSKWLKNFCWVEYQWHSLWLVSWVGSLTHGLTCDSDSVTRAHPWLLFKLFFYMSVTISCNVSQVTGCQLYQLLMCHAPSPMGSHAPVQWGTSPSSCHNKEPN